MTDNPDDLGGGGAHVGAIVDRIADGRRRIAALQAEEALLLRDAQTYAIDRIDPATAHPDRPRDIVLRSVAAEIGAATLQSDRAVQARMSEATVLVDRFPVTWAHLRDGRISRAHAAVISDAGQGISDDAARTAYENAVLTVAVRETPGRLRPVARRLAERYHPISLTERHRTARRARRMWVVDREDGMAEFGLLAPAHLAHAVFNRATQEAVTILSARAADSVEEPDVLAGSVELCAPDTRTLDEIRADIAFDLLLTGHATLTAISESVGECEAIRAHVQVTIPLLSLTGESDAPAELKGHGPISAEAARELAGVAAGWDRLLTHPVSGAILAVDRYRPTQEQKRMLRARDEHCRFPGCRQPTRRCDLDHTVARAHDGPTDIRNLAHLCRRHHTLKHHSAWRVRQLPGGVLEWTSPAGRVHDDRPARTLAFATPDVAPF
ncbi:HNH endonuclease signature motif containing protein [Microbacterium sp.]|uniref:HNH endonuclease signature motif containing protein n=1 Tax=Microbacterium sp. TaxID=51671 RepID=UPI0025F49B70|nr:HNH endonuclease signature motif containing protein [Microbacterium sp.]